MNKYTMVGNGQWFKVVLVVYAKGFDKEGSDGEYDSSVRDSVVADCGSTVFYVAGCKAGFGPGHQGLRVKDRRDVQNHHNPKNARLATNV
jgi:hypothetical protein